MRPMDAEIVDSIPSPLAVLDASGVIIQVNDAWQAFAKANRADNTVAQGVGANYLAICAAADGTGSTEAPDAHAGISAVLKGELGAFSLEYPCHSASVQRWFLMTVAPYKGFPGHAVVMHLDITDRKLAELHNASFDHILEDSLNEVFIFEAQTLRFVRVNKGARDNLGYSMAELRGMTPVDIKPDYTFAQFHLLISALDSEKLVFDTVHQRKNGSTYPVEVHLERTLLGATPVFVAIILDITERKHAEQSLRAANVELEARVRARTKELRAAKDVAEKATATKFRFLAAASHDLRQPLQSLSLYLSALALQLSEPAHLDTTKRMESSLETVNALLSALLDISKFEAGMVETNRRDVSLQAIFDRVVTDTIQQAEAKELRLACVSTDCVVHSDAALLERIIENFVINAIRYTEHGRVTIEAEANDKVVKISVTDTGVGMPQEALGQIFEEYYQLENPPRGRNKGLGLGLAIVKHIARLLNHPLDVRSVLGEGSTFSVEVPLGRAFGTRVATRRVAKTVVGSSRQAVLFVDDDLAIVEAMTMLLSSQAFEVHSATSGDAALARIAAGVRPNIIITDYRMPGCSGIELIERARRSLAVELPAILMTGDTSSARIDNAGLKNCAVLHKPVNADGLLALIERLTAQLPGS